MKESLLGNDVVSGKKKKAVVIFCREKYPSLMIVYILIHQMFIEAHLVGM